MASSCRWALKQKGSGVGESRGTLSWHGVGLISCPHPQYLPPAPTKNTALNTVLGLLFSSSDKLFPVTVLHPSPSISPNGHGPEELLAILSQRLNNPNSSSRYEYLWDTMLNLLQTYFTSLLTQPLRVTVQVKRLGSEKVMQKQQGSIQTWVLPLPTCLPGPPMGSRGPKL